MVKIYYDKDADTKVLKGKKVAVMGYGSQGHAHANNLRDSGADVIIGVKKGGAGWSKAEKAGFPVFIPSEAAKRADIIMMLVPDEYMADIYKVDIAPHMVVIVNEPSGGGAVGTDYAAKARPDGYTVYFSTNSVLTISPHLVKALPYRPGDLTPIGAFAVDLGVVTVRAGGPARTLEEFVEQARKNPGRLNYGSAGFGTVSFFSMELFKLSYGLDLVHVPFQGTGPVKNAVLGGHVTVATSGFGSLALVIKSGDLVALVTTSPRRVKEFPNVPTLW